MVRTLSYNNKILSPEEREEFYKLADETINEFSASIDGMHQIIKEDSSSLDEITSTIINVSTFINICYGDCIVLTKYFIMATNPYAKRCLRGKLKVLLNESFKKLYGFNDKGYKESYCAKLENIIQMFPSFRNKFNAILSDLEDISKHSWWKDERNAEVHIDVMKLYESRQEEINESKVAMETMQLIDFFQRFNRLMAILNQTYINHTVRVLKERGILNREQSYLA